MNLFNNPLKIFERENEENFFKIKAEDIREEVRKLTDYISTSSVSVYQVQIIRKDLIGMALEAEQDRISLEEKLGRDPMEFCDDVISSVGKSSSGEIVLNMAVYAMSYFALYYAVGFFLLWDMPKQWGISIADIIVILSVCVLSGVVMKRLNHKMSFEKNSRFYGILFLIVTICSYGAYFIRKTGVGDVFLIRGNGWLILSVLLVIAVGFIIVRNRYWEHRIGNQ